MSDYQDQTYNNKTNTDVISTDKVFHFMMHAATRKDISELRQEFQSEFSAFRQEIKSEILRLDNKMGSFFEKLDKKIDESVEKLDKKMDLSIQKLDQKIDRMLWGFVGITGAVITASAVQLVTHFI